METLARQFENELKDKMLRAKKECKAIPHRRVGAILPEVI